MSNPKKSVSGFAERAPYIPNGEYIGEIVDVLYKMMWGKTKIIILIKIEGFQAPLPRYLNHYEKYKHYMDAYRTWTILNGSPPLNGEEITFDRFIGTKVRCTVIQSCKNSKGGLKVKGLETSKIGEIIGLVTNNQKPTDPPFSLNPLPNSLNLLPTTYLEKETIGKTPFSFKNKQHHALVTSLARCYAETYSMEWEKAFEKAYKETVVE
jgi:hypothetical protein